MQKAPLSKQAQKEQDRLKAQRESQLKLKEQQLNKLPDEEIVQQLKNKGLGVYGTKQEKLERLKKFLGIPEPYIQPGIEQPDSKKATPPKSNVVENIEKMKQRREERRTKMEEMKQEKAERKAENHANGRLVDVEFEIMIDKHRLKEGLLQEHQTATNVKLCVCVRKRPIFKKEEQSGEIDAVSCSNPVIRVHEPKLKVDGITKFVENHTFNFDNTFSEREESIDIYETALKPLLETLFNQGVITCFAYGQTGSGKTYTMRGIQEETVKDIFDMMPSDMSLSVSFFEIYGGKCYDLLNNKSPLAILEDKNNNIQVQGLVEKPALTANELLQIMDYGNSIRTTHVTVANDTSSRSHAICSFIIKDDSEKEIGKLILVDLAGSERAQDTQSNNRQRRMEGAEINKSLLALKECIRAMDDNAQHVPFRASKLTLVLRDSFTARANKSKIVMIACVSPGSSSADHTLNTLRYADRLKDKSNQPKLTIEERGENEQVQGNNKENNVKPNENYLELPKIKPVPAPPPKVQFSQNNAQVEEEQKINNANGQRAQWQNKNGISKQPSLPSANPKKIEERNQQNDKLKPPPSKQQSKKDKDGDSFVKNESPIEDDEDVPIVKPVNNVKEDVRCMKETMKQQNQEENKEEFFDFQEKVNTILEEQDEILAIHMAAIKEDAKILTQESELIQQIQGIGIVDYDIDTYVGNLELFIKKKLKIYNLLYKKIQLFKVHLKEEEEISSKMKNTFYY